MTTPITPSEAAAIEDRARDLEVAAIDLRLSLSACLPCGCGFTAHEWDIRNPKRRQSPPCTTAGCGCPGYRTRVEAA